MKVFPISEFKARCIRILKAVARNREPVVVTLRGKPIARVESMPRSDGKRKLGALRGTVEIRGDIIHSDLAEDWDR